MTTAGTLSFAISGNGLPPPLLSLNGPTGIPPFRNANPSDVQSLDAGFISLVQPTNPSLQIASSLTNAAVTPVAPTEYTRQYSAEIYAVVFNGLTEGRSTSAALQEQTAAQQAQNLSALQNPPPLQNAPATAPPAQPATQAPSTPAPAVTAPTSNASASGATASTSTAAPPAAAASTPPAAAPSSGSPSTPNAASDPAPAPSQAAATNLQIDTGAPPAATPAQAVTNLAPSGAGA